MVHVKSRSNINRRVVVTAERLLVDGALVGPRTLVLEHGRIDAVLDEPPPDAADRVVLDDGVLTPGLIDLHVNGAFGVDFAQAPPESWADVLGQLAERGVTSVQPTFITAPLDRLRQAGGACAEAERDRPATAARVLGAHLEGPFLSPARKGAHDPRWIVDPTPARVDALLEGSTPPPLTVTLAPERPGALAAIRTLVAHGVLVSLGHTDASSEDVGRAVDAGATMVTHLFNAQRGLHHRDPGVPGAALTDPRLALGLILDLHHVHPDVCRLAFAAAPGRVFGVTDAILTAGLPPHSPREFGGLRVANDLRGVGRRPDGTFAGAGIVLDEGVRRIMAAGLDPATALASCTEVAAEAIGRDDLGHLRAGCVADLVWWDADFRPRRIWTAGQALAPGGGSELPDH